MMQKEWKLGFTLVMFTTMAFGCKDGTAFDSQKAKEVSALFDQFETIFYTSADLLTASRGYKQLQEQNARFLRYPFMHLRIGIEALGKSTSSEILRNADYILVGAKDFMPPGGMTGLGAMRSKFCYVIHLHPRSELLIDKIGKSPAVASAGEGIWKWSAGVVGDGKSSESLAFYAVQSAHSQILISSSIDELHVLSQRLSPHNRTEPPNTTLDWEELRQQDLWGYRHYLHKKNENKAASGTLEIALDTQALMFFVDFKQSTGVLRLFSLSSRTADKINGKGRMPPLKAIRPGTWQMTIPLSENPNTLESMFIVLGLFGFGIAL
jgi:hypothetical protein